MEKDSRPKRQTYPSLIGVDWDIVWDIIKNKIPDLNEKIRRLIKEEF